MEMKADPQDIETLKLFLIIAGSLIVILGGMVGVLIKYLVAEKKESEISQLQDFKGLLKTVSETVAEQSRVVQGLKSTTEGIKGIMSVIKAQQLAFEKLIGDRLSNNSSRIDSHGEDIKRIDKKVTELDTRCIMKIKQLRTAE